LSFFATQEPCQFHKKQRDICENKRQSDREEGRKKEREEEED
jgi:hypothetical protein